jgi:hypothetical protein
LQEPKPKPDAVAKAEAALQSFLASMKALTSEQAAPLWCAIEAHRSQSVTPPFAAIPTPAIAPISANKNASNGPLVEG